MRKRLFLTLALFAGLLGTYAQTLKEGIEAVDHEQYDLAFNIFNKIVTVDPKNSFASYWLSQLYINREDEKSAYAVLTKALEIRKGKDKVGIIYAGLGELYATATYKDTAKARDYFNKALAVGSKNLEVLKAIARANVHAPYGNPTFAIQVLEQAMNLKNADLDVTLQILLGYAYKKDKSYVNMLRTFTKVVRMNPEYAQGYFILAKSYANLNDKTPYLENLWNAIRADPKYPAPIYELYVYYFSEDKPDSAKYYLNKYRAIANKNDPALQATLAASDAELDYISKNYKLALDQTIKNNEIYKEQAKNNRTYRGRLWRLATLCYTALSDSSYQAHDSINGKKYAQLALQQVRLYIKDENGILDPSDIPYLTDRDFSLYALTAIKCLPEGEVDFNEAYTDILQMKNRVDEKLVTLNAMREIAEKYHYFAGVANAWDSIIVIKKPLTYSDYFYAGIANYTAQRYQQAKKFFQQYLTIAGDESIYGYLWLARVEDKLDTVAHKKVAVVDNWNKYLQEALKNPQKYQSGIIEAYTMLGANSMLDNKYNEALPYWDNILAIDPNNVTALTMKQDILNYQKQMAAYEKQKAAAEAKAKKGTAF